MKFHCPTGGDYIVDSNTQSMVEKKLMMFQSLVHGNGNNSHVKVVIVTTKEEQSPRNSLFGNITKTLLTYDKAFKPGI